MSSGWDAVVIGSGIGGLGAAAALADAGRRVLLLERHTQAGGLTQTFERDGFRFSVGVHYLGGLAEGQLSRRLFDRLAGGRIAFAPIAGVYDRVRFPDFSIAFTPPRQALQQILTTEFPHEAEGLRRYFDAIDAAAEAMGWMFAARSAPPLVARPLAWLKRGRIARWVGRTTWDVVCECVRDDRLRAVLCAQWGDYGSRPADSSFGMHATVARHYFDGAWYPVGGSRVFADAFARTIESAGGVVRTGAEVVRIDTGDGRVRGVTLDSGETLACPCVVSDIGLHRTLRLLPSSAVDYAWAAEALALQQSLGYVGLYLGLEGDIATHGADPANAWIYDSWDVNRVWRDPLIEPRAPAMFVSFPSLRDPDHDPGPRRRHTAEIVALVDWSVFSQWDRTDEPHAMTRGTPSAARSEGYLAFKDLIGRNLRAQFGEHFPDLAPMVRLTEVSTPISVATYTGAEHGAMVGLETTPQRFLSPATGPRTPVGGLYLAGQDAGTPGVTGAFFGGLMAAACVESAIWKLLR